MPRTLSYLNVGKAEWCQSHCVLVASGMALGTGGNVNLALGSSAGALLVTDSASGTKGLLQSIEAMTRYRNICHGRAVNSGLLYSISNILPELLLSYPVL